MDGNAFTVLVVGLLVGIVLGLLIARNKWVHEKDTHVAFFLLFITFVLMGVAVLTGFASPL